jgi:hypothetical protein
MATGGTVERPVIRRRRAGGIAPYRERVAPYRRERQEFGGRIQWEAVFFGLLAAIGLGASLVAMVLGGLVAAGVTDFGQPASSLVDRMFTGGGAIAVAILALGYMAGGYVAARMARFDGWRQGVGAWLLSLLLVLAAGITAWIAGGELDPAKSISLPSNPIDEGPLSDGGVVLAAVAVVVPLLFAVLGGMLGERFHRAVDRAGFEPVPVPEPDREGEDDDDDEEESEDREREQRTAEQEEETEPVVWP